MTPHLLKIETDDKTTYINLNNIASVDITMDDDNTTNEEIDYKFIFRGERIVVEVGSTGEHALQIIEELDRLARP